MSLEKYRSRVPATSELQKAAELVWKEHITLDLIYGRGLLLCLSCFAVFHQSIEGDDHPGDHVVVVHRFFADMGITSCSRFVDFLQNAISDTPVLDPSINPETTLKPFYSKHHPPLAPKRAHLLQQTASKQGQDTHADLLAQLAIKEDAITVLHDELSRLLNENEQLLKQLFSLRHNQTHRYRLIQSLADEISSISGGCASDCTCQDKKTMNSTK